MSKLRSINTVIWSDTWFEVLDPSAKLLFIYLVTNEKTNMLGVYEISLRKVSFETGIKINDIDKYLKEFELSCKIKYSNNRVLLLNFLKHQNYNFNMMKSAIRTYNELPNELKLLNFNTLEETKQGFETLCKGFAGVSKYELELEYELEYEIESEVIEKNYRKFAHLKISFEEFDKLNEEYSKELIDEVLDKIENYKKNTSYKSLFLTAKNWLKKEKEKSSDKKEKPVIGRMTESVLKSNYEKFLKAAQNG